MPLSHAGQHWAVSVVTREDNSHHTLLVAAPMYHMNALFNLKFAFLNRARVILQPSFTAESYIHAIESYLAHLGADDAGTGCQLHRKRSTPVSLRPGDSNFHGIVPVQ